MYETEYGTTFGCANAGDALIKHSFRDYGLYPRSKPVIAPPEPKRLAVDIPGADGELDYTEALTGDVHYNNRPGTFSFVVKGNRTSWENVYHTMLRDLHGKRMGVVLDEDNGGYYYGRLKVLEPEYDGKLKKMCITVEGDFYPYRYDLYSTIQPWVWDTFVFPTGIIRYYKDISITTSATVKIVGSQMPQVPDVVLKSGSLSMTYPTASGNKTVALESGSNVNKTPDFIIRSGEYNVSFTGTGVIDIVYRGGAL